MLVFYFFVSAHCILQKYLEMSMRTCINVTDLLRFGNLLNSLMCAVFCYLTQNKLLFVLLWKLTVVILNKIITLHVVIICVGRKFCVQMFMSVQQCSDVM